MSTQGGLQRRRVAAASTSSNGFVDPDEDRPSAPNTAPTTPNSNVDRDGLREGRVAHAGTAMEGGSKVAYDPRDLVGAGSGGTDDSKVPKLTLLEEVLLLGIKDRAGYLSFWNDNISYALRGCIIIELALRRRIAVVKDPARRRLPLADRPIEVLSDRQTGETILDEALRLMKSQQDGPGGGVQGEKMGVGSWVDLMSGETWNVLKIGYQLKQVRERLAKGLVDKGVLRTEKRNFLLFDMATHPVADPTIKESIMSRVVALLTARTTSIPPAALHSSKTDAAIDFPITRAVSLVCAAYAASVLDNALVRLGYDEREAAFNRSDELLSEFCIWPLGTGSPGGSTRRGVGTGGSGPTSRELILALVQAVKAEMTEGKEGDDLCFEVIVTVFEVFSRMDSLLG